MVLRQAKVGEVPQNAVRLTEEEAFKYQLEAAENWRPSSEMWPLLQGSLVLGAVASLSTALINNTYRTMCYLPKTSVVFVGIPLVAVSAFSTTLFDYQVINKDILLMKSPCVPCTQTKTALLLGFWGTVYPVAVGSIGNMLHAQRINSIYIPSLIKEPRKFFQEWRKLTNKKGNFFSSLFLLNVAVAFVIAYLKQEASYKLNQR